MIWEYNVPSPPYLFPTIQANGGSIRNTGVEVSIQVTPVSTKDFQWVTNINYSSNANKLVTLSGKFVASTYLDTGTTGSPMWQATHRIQEGQPFGNFGDISLLI